MNAHHAIVCIADTLEESVVPEVYKKQSNDVSHIVLDRFSISDARKLSQDALQKPIDSEYRVFVLVVKKLPAESQNALLKLFEEPPAKTRFYLVVPQEGVLISTLRSRVFFEIMKPAQVNENVSFISFLSASYAKRLSVVVDITKKKDLHTIEDILRGAEIYASKDPLQNKSLLETVMCIRAYSKTPGASVKILLEEIALSLPKV